MNLNLPAFPASPPYYSQRPRVLCPVCRGQRLQIGNVHLISQDQDGPGGQYFRLDPEHGVVAARQDDPTQRVRGRVVIVNLHGECGHSFDLVLHNEGAQTLIFHASEHPLAVVNQPVPEPPPAQFLCPSLWLAFIQQMSTLDATAHAGLLVCTPLLNRPRHLVLCFGRTVPAVVDYLRRLEVRETMIETLGKVAGPGWAIEVLVSHVLDGAG